MNGQYINKITPEEFLKLLLPELKAKGWVNDSTDKNWLTRVAGLFKERARTLNDFFDWSEYVFKDEVKYEADAVKKRINKPGVIELLETVTSKFSAAKDFNKESLEEIVRKLAEEMKIKAADIIHPVRVAVSGRAMGPGLFELLAVLGRDKVIKRLEAAKKLV